MMKNISITLLIILSAASVNAQVMPQELTCTEKAFNFSFSVGTKLKISAPKIGPADVTSYEPDLTPGWPFKLNDVKPGINLQPEFENLGYCIQQQNDSHSGFKLVNKPAYLLPNVDFNSSINYKPYIFGKQTYNLLIRHITQISQKEVQVLQIDHLNKYQIYLNKKKFLN